jgi:hypothetical protein
MTVSDLLEQPCNKSDNINKVVTSCSQFVPNLLTTWGTQCEDNLLADLLQDVRLLRVSVYVQGREKYRTTDPSLLHI